MRFLGKTLAILAMLFTFMIVGSVPQANADMRCRLSKHGHRQICEVSNTHVFKHRSYDRGVWR